MSNFTILRGTSRVLGSTPFLLCDYCAVDKHTVFTKWHLFSAFDPDSGHSGELNIKSDGSRGLPDIDYKLIVGQLEIEALDYMFGRAAEAEDGQRLSSNIALLDFTEVKAPVDALRSLVYFSSDKKYHYIKGFTTSVQSRELGGYLDDFLIERGRLNFERSTL